MQKPDILLIMTDQQSFNAMGCAGNAFIQTPAMDRLAALGVRFDLAYCSYPHCVPSRSGMMYGCMPHEALYPGTSINLSGKSSGPIGVREEFRDQEIAKLLARQGYDCVYAGKWHVGTWGPTESLREEYDTAFRPLCDLRDPDLPEACAAYLDTRDTEKPFFLVASLDNPHNICEWGFGTPLPWGNLPEPPARNAPASAATELSPSYDEPGCIRSLRHGQTVEHGWTGDDWRRYRWAYNRLVEKADYQIGRLLDILEKRGLFNRTVLIFTSDHGDQQGAHELKHKSLFYEEAIRVPFILCDPAGNMPGRVDSETLVSNALDLYATLADYGGAPLPEGMHGQSLRPIAEGRTIDQPRAFVASEHENFHGPRRRMIRTRRYKYCVYENGVRTEQLFDLETDPGEMVNLVTCAAYADVLAEHRRICFEWMRDTDDHWHRGHYAHPGVERVAPGADFPEASGTVGPDA